MEKERISLYPERQSDSIELTLDRLKKLEAGEIKKIELSEEEQEQLKSIENELGTEFEKIFDLNPITETIYLDYFLTDEGKENLREVTNLNFEGNYIDEIKAFLIENRKIISEIDIKTRKSLFAKGEKYIDDKIYNEIIKTVDEDGNINTEKIANPSRVSILTNSDEAFKKISGLRDFKQKIKLLKTAFDENNDSENFKKAINIILKIYSKKINELIASNFHLSTTILNYINQTDNTIRLSDEEKSLIELFPKKRDSEKSLSRYDKFIHGASSEYTNKERYQISEELKKHADEVEELFINNELTRDERIRKKGLDPEKVFEENFRIEELAHLAELLLDKYGEKSVEPASSYIPERDKPASDNKWQVVYKDYIKSADVNSKEKVIKFDIKDRSIFKAFTVNLGHESGHFVQNLNSLNIDLKIFDKIKGDRRSVLAEAGAMYFEDQVSKTIFGINKIPLPHYVRAMQKRLESGNYIDCVKAYYESKLKLTTKKRDKGILTENKFKTENNDSLKTSIKVIKRLFGGGNSLEESSYLFKSKDTAYLEQRKIMNKMKEQGMEKYAFVLGINLETLADLIELGKINQKEIKEPNMDYLLEIWDLVKDNYKS